MDARLIFRDSLDSIKTDAGTQRQASTRQWFPWGGETRPGKANPPGRLPGKAAKEDPAIRTTNRHRWTSRAYSGARVMDCSGTRQIGPVTSGEGAPQQCGRSETRQATV